MSHLKGITTIQLFDAETGELQQEVKEENMVTNAVEYILNPPDYFSAGLDRNEDRSVNLVPQKKSVLDNFFNGVLLFQNPITENVNNLMSPFDNPSIGNAGSSTTSTNSQRGSYNSIESGPIPNGYRRVWDFATDKVNGKKISCVCLTSRAGGDVGVNRTEAYYSGGPRFTEAYSYSSSEKLYMIKTNTFPKNILPSSEISNYEGRPFYIEQQTNGNIRILMAGYESISNKQNAASIFEIILGNPFQQKLFNFSRELLSFKKVYTIGQSTNLYYDWYKDGKTEDPGDSACYDILSIRRDNLGNQYQPCRPYVYNNKIHLLYTCSTRGGVGSIKHIILNLETYAIEQEKIITLQVPPYEIFKYSYNSSTSENPPAYSVTINGKQKWVYPRYTYTYTWDSSGAVFFDNHYFYRSAKGITVADANGNELQSIDETNWNGISYIDEHQKLLLISGWDTSSPNKNVYYMVFKDPTTNQYKFVKYDIAADAQMYSSYGVHCTGMMKIKNYSFPLYCFGAVYIYSSALYCEISFGHIYTFLSTINNLSTPVTKTSGQTMKITYDIIQVED